MESTIQVTERLPKIFYYLGIAKAVSARSTCISKNYGAIVVNNDEVVSTGFNGAPRGMSDCITRGNCPRILHNVQRGTRYDYCRSVHAEMNALISGGRKQMLNGTIYLYGWDVRAGKVVTNPGVCIMCKRMIINAGIGQIIYADPDGIAFNPEVGYGYHMERIQDWVDADEDLPPWEGPGY